DQAVVALGHDAGPAADHLDARTPGAEARTAAPLQQAVERPDPVGRDEVAAEAIPVVRIVLAQQGDEPLLGTIRLALLGVVVEERAAPPAHLVVREVPDAIGVASVRRDEAARPRSKPPPRRRVEWIDPVEAGRQAEVEVRDHGEAEEARRERPGARGVKAPADDARTRRAEPAPEVGEERRPVTVDAPARLAPRSPAVDPVDADRVEALAARRDEPGDAAVRGERPSRFGGGGPRAGGTPAGSRREQADGRQHEIPSGALHVAVIAY